MVAKDDWRRMGQEKYLLNASLKHVSNFVPYSETWEHEHCAFCFAKFSTSNGDLHEGYCSTDEKRSHWVCPQCFMDFHEEFNWAVV